MHDEIMPHNNPGRWDRGLDRPDECLYVASIDGAIVGYLVGEYYKDWSYGHEIAVTQHRQGQGVGSRLLLAWADDAVEAGAGALLVKPLPGATWERLDRYYRSIGFSGPEVGGHLQASPRDVAKALRVDR